MSFKPNQLKYDSLSKGMFIIDEFEYHDDVGNLLPKTQPPQIGGGGTYAAIGARIFLDSCQIGMVVDQGADFPPEILAGLLAFGEDMWLFRGSKNGQTTRALNKYMGQHRGFEYLTPRIRISPKDLHESPNFSRPIQLHFICSPTRAVEIIDMIKGIDDWMPLIIYEPIPDKCIPEELPSLVRASPSISIFSPNSEEALSLLSIQGPPTRDTIQRACSRFLELGVGEDAQGHVIIRSGALGAYMGTRGKDGAWVDAFWGENDFEKIIDVTGAGNAFLGGLSAGLMLSGDDVLEAMLYASVSASFVIEQYGLPRLTGPGAWNNDEPMRRLQELKTRLVRAR